MGIADFHVFYLPRVLCALGLIWFNSTTIVAMMSTPPRTTELFESWHKNQIVDTLLSLGPVCTDLLFVISGFFITMKLVMMKEASPSPVAWWRFVIYRSLRFLPMLVCLLIIAFVSHDAVFWASGSFDWERGLALFGWQNHANQEWLDFSTFLAWTLSVEMHCVLLLSVVITALYRSDQKPTQQLWMLVLLAVNIRGYVLATSDADCLLRECISNVTVVLPAAGPTFVAEFEKMGGHTLQDRGNACPLLCVGATAQEQFGAYLATMLLPSYMHFVPFLLGSILFFEYISAYQRVNDSNKRSWNAWSSLLIGPALVWLLNVHQALPEDFAFLLHLLLPPAFREALWPLLYAGSWCGILFCALVPVAHPAKSFPSTRLLSLPAFELPARFSFGLSLFHWPVQWAIFRHFALPLPESPFFAAVVVFAVVLFCTIPFAVGFELFIDGPWRAFLRRVFLQQLPSIRSLQDRPVAPPPEGLPPSTPPAGNRKVQSKKHA